MSHETAGSTGYTTTVTVTSFASAVADVRPVMPAQKAVVVAPAVKMYEIRTDLPEGHLLGIARIMVEWSRQEWTLMQILFDLATGDPKMGRVVLGFPRGHTAVARIEDAAEVRGITIATPTKSLKTDLQRLETYRDQIGHGVWIVDEAARWCAVVYSGNWEGGSEWSGTSKRIIPHAKPIDEADLAKHLAEIQGTLAVTRAIWDEVKAGLARSSG